ncbi:MAG: hypothetical protein ACRC14_01345, partial [Paracoccaceae bacterium]
MKKTIKFPRYDAELNTDVCSINANAELTLTLRLGFRQINPKDGAATGTYKDYGKTTGTPRKIVKWTPATWESWKSNFCSSAAGFWRGKFWLVNDGGSCPFKAKEEWYFPNFICWLDVVGSDAGAADLHHTIDVVNLDPTETWFGSHETLYDSLDTNSNEKAKDSKGNPIMQQAHVHEVGHLLGLDHVDVGKAHCKADSDTNATKCYGITDRDKNSVMGSGMGLREEQAMPWRVALRAFALEEARANVDRRFNAGVPISQLFVIPKSIYATWPARLNRVFPRNLAEFKAGTEP